MKKYKFRLERVLDYRKIIKNEKQRELTLKLHELNMARNKLEELKRAELANALDEGPLSELKLYMSGAYGARLKDQIVDSRLAVIRCEDEVDEAIAAYREAAKDEKALVTLKDKQLLEYKAALELEERKFLDELTIRRGNTLQDDVH